MQVDAQFELELDAEETDDIEDGEEVSSILSVSPSLPLCMLLSHLEVDMSTIVAN